MVRPVYEALKAKIAALIRRNRKVRAFLRYFERQWMSKVTIWNVYDVLSHRTNNNLEGTHRLFLTLFGISPNLWRFVEVLQSIDEVKMMEEERHKLGHPPTKRKRQYREKEESLAAMRALYEVTGKTVGDTLNYISRVSSLFRYGMK
jgi:hypothetical protein